MLSHRTAYIYLGLVAVVPAVRANIYLQLGPNPDLLPYDVGNTV